MAVSSVIGWFSQDSDHLFSYHTRQQVEVRFKLLGFVEKILQGSVGFYILFGVFFLGEGYFEYDTSQGALITHVTGSALGVSLVGSQTTRYFAADDLSIPNLENGNVFVTTKVDVEEQVRGVCEDPHMQCEKDDDCSKGVGAQCTKDKVCLEPSWCPVKESKDMDSYKLPSEDFRIWIKSAIIFSFGTEGGDGGKKKMYSSRFDAPILYPNPGFNTFTVKELLLLCDPPVRYEEISELGAAIEVQFKWNCIIDYIYGCKLGVVRAQRVDSQMDHELTGFEFTNAVSMGTGLRQMQRQSGIRFYMRTIGTASKFSMAEVIFKVSTGLALLGFAPVITDFVMLNLLKGKKKFEARKFEHTKAFNQYLKDESEAGLSVYSLIENQRELWQTVMELHEKYDDDEALADKAWRIEVDEGILPIVDEKS